jgi:hypothetical protein
MKLFEKIMAWFKRPEKVEVVHVSKVKQTVAVRKRNPYRRMMKNVFSPHRLRRLRRLSAAFNDAR